MANSVNQTNHQLSESQLNRRLLTTSLALALLGGVAQSRAQTSSTVSGTISEQALDPRRRRALASLVTIQTVSIVRDSGRANAAQLARISKLETDVSNALSQVDAARSGAQNRLDAARAAFDTEIAALRVTLQLRDDELMYFRTGVIGDLSRLTDEEVRLRQRFADGDKSLMPRMLSLFRIRDEALAKAQNARRAIGFRDMAQTYALGLSRGDADLTATALLDLWQQAVDLEPLHINTKIALARVALACGRTSQTPWILDPAAWPNATLLQRMSIAGVAMPYYIQSGKAFSDPNAIDQVNEFMNRRNPGEPSILSPDLVPGFIDPILSDLSYFPELLYFFLFAYEFRIAFADGIANSYREFTGTLANDPNLDASASGAKLLPLIVRLDQMAFNHPTMARVNEEQKLAFRVASCRALALMLDLLPVSNPDNKRKIGLAIKPYIQSVMDQANRLTAQNPSMRRRHLKLQIETVDLGLTYGSPVAVGSLNAVESGTYLSNLAPLLADLEALVTLDPSNTSYLAHLRMLQLSYDIVDLNLFPEKLSRKRHVQVALGLVKVEQPDFIWVLPLIGSTFLYLRERNPDALLMQELLTKQRRLVETNPNVTAQMRATFLRNMPDIATMPQPSN